MSDRADVAERSFSVVPPAQLPERNGLVSFFGAAKRVGSWSVPRHLRVVSAFGSVELDLREAVLSDGTTHIEVVAVLGSVSIIVPPGVRVETEGDAVVGSFVYSAAGVRAPAPGAPVVRISGTAFLAEVETKVKGSAEPREGKGGAGQHPHAR